MLRSIILLMIIFLAGQPVKAKIDELDSFIGTHCLSACNSEGPSCDDCRRTAVELFSF
jgi:hypothetical protein